MKRRELIRLAAAAPLSLVPTWAVHSAAQPRILIPVGTQFIGVHLTQPALKRGYQP